MAHLVTTSTTITQRLAISQDTTALMETSGPIALRLVLVWEEDGKELLISILVQEVIVQVDELKPIIPATASVINYLME